MKLQRLEKLSSKLVLIAGAIFFALFFAIIFMFSFSQPVSKFANLPICEFNLAGWKITFSGLVEPSNFLR